MHLQSPFANQKAEAYCGVKWPPWRQQEEENAHSMILTANSASPGLGLNSVTPLIANQGRKQSLNPAKIKNEERKKKISNSPEQVG